MTKKRWISLLVENEIGVLARISGLFSGKSYNLNDAELMPKVAGICDNCGKKLIKRDDDNVEAFIVRYNNFLTNTKVLIDYYKDKNKLHIVDVNRNINDIFNDISRIVAND